MSNERRERLDELLSQLRQRRYEEQFRKDLPHDLWVAEELLGRPRETFQLRTDPEVRTIGKKATAAVSEILHRERGERVREPDRVAVLSDAASAKQVFMKAAEAIGLRDGLLFLDNFGSMAAIESDATEVAWRLGHLDENESMSLVSDTADRGLEVYRDLTEAGVYGWEIVVWRQVGEHIEHVP
ncbi:MAG: hypothetical protein ACRDN9_07840 [Streptosporangiaceae bacterium]